MPLSAVLPSETTLKQDKDQTCLISYPKCALYGIFILCDAQLGDGGERSVVKEVWETFKKALPLKDLS